MITGLRVRAHVHCDAFSRPHTSENMSSRGDNERIWGEERERGRERSLCYVYQKFVNAVDIFFFILYARCSLEPSFRFARINKFLCSILRTEANLEIIHPDGSRRATIDEESDKISSLEKIFIHKTFREAKHEQSRHSWIIIVIVFIFFTSISINVNF